MKYVMKYNGYSVTALVEYFWSINLKISFNTYPKTFKFDRFYPWWLSDISIIIEQQKLCQKLLKWVAKGSSFYHLCIEYFSQFSFDSEMYTKSAIVLKELLILYIFLNQMRIEINIRHEDDFAVSLSERKTAKIATYHYTLKPTRDYT